jgi:hypothetical protein
MSPMSPDRIYQIYGLRVRSELPLPVMRAANDGRIDLVVRGCNVMPRPGAPPSTAMTLDWRQVEQGWRLRYHDHSDEALEFTFDSEVSRLDIRCTLPDLTDDIVAVLLGPVLAAALYLRGVPVLHASAVVVDGAAILVAGPAGAGKSTLTATLVGKGMPLLAEDLAVLGFGENGISVQAGYPRLRLCPDATLVAGKAAPDLPRVFSASVPDDKRWLDAATLPGGFQAAPAPLKAVYLLAPRRSDKKTFTIEPLPSHHAGLVLLAHLYGARWLRIPKAKALEWCARIASRTPVRIVHASSGLARVSETADAIIADARRPVATTEPIAH